jgi:LacI family transcriptional regulator
MQQLSAPVTIRDVAREAGVSPATVSRVLNGINSVDGDLVARVNEAVSRTGYVLNIAGRALRRQVSALWAAIVPDAQNPFFTAVVASFEDTALAAGHSVMLCNTSEDLERERTYLRSAVAAQMAGVVIAVASLEKSDLSPLIQAGIPTVLVDRRVRSFDGDSVLTDNLKAGELAAAHLRQRGFRTVSCIVGPETVATTEDRLRGFHARSHEEGIGLMANMVERADLQTRGGYAAMKKLLGAADPPDAVFVTNGPMTVGAFQAIKEERGTRGETALVGMDDDLWMRMVDPQVTVVQQPVDEIGRLAGELLRQRREEPGRSFQHITLSPRLLARGSTLG